MRRVLLVSMMLLMVIPLLGQRREVAGRITDPGGKPVRGVTVDLRFRGEIQRSAVSDAQGFFRFEVEGTLLNGKVKVKAKP